MSGVRRSWAVVLVVFGIVAAPGVAHSDTWSPEAVLSATGQEGWAPDVSVSADGTRAVAVWTPGASSLPVRSASAVVVDGVASWSSPVDVTPTRGPAGVPAVRLSADGSRATAVWFKSGSGLESASAVLADGILRWGPVVPLPDNYSTVFSLAMSTDGSKALAVWTSGQFGQTETVYAASATIADGVTSWGAATPVSTVGKRVRDPRVSLSADGTRAVAVWSRNDEYPADCGPDGGCFRIETASVAVSGQDMTWGGVSVLSKANGDALAPRVALSANGAVTAVAWTRESGGSRFVESASAAIADLATTWSKPVRLSPPGRSSRPQIGLSADGSGATAVWVRSKGADRSVQSSSAVISDGTAQWGTPATVSAGGANVGATKLQLAVSADGARATALWRRSAPRTGAAVTSASAHVSGTSAEWGPAAMVGPGSVGAPRLGMSADGSTATAVWADWDDTGTRGQVLASSSILSP